MVEEQKKMMKFSKVHRSIYSFNITRLSIPIRRFIRKSQELTPEAIREYITSLFKATVRKDATAKKQAKAMEYKSPFIKNLVLFFIIGLILVVGYGAFIYMSIIGRPEIQTGPNIELPPTPNVSISLADSGFLDSAGKDTRWFTTVDVEGQGLDQLNISMVVQQNEVPQDVYVLRVPNAQLASHYPEFYSIMKETLTNKGIFISEITVQELLSLPKNRRITLIVPTGYMPSVFLGVDKPSFDMKSFARDGNVLVYVGYAPTEMLTPDIPGPQPVSSEVLRTFGLMFPDENAQSPSFSFMTQYAVRAIPTDASSSTIKGQAGEYSVNWGREGFAYFVPTTIDFWWASAGNRSALELSDAIISARWGTGLSKGTFSINATDGIVQKRRVVIFSEAFKPQKDVRIGRAYAQIFIQGIKSKDNVSSIRGKVAPVLFGDRMLGNLDHSEEAVSYQLTDTLIDIKYSLNEQSSALKQVFLSVVASNGSEMAFLPVTANPISLKISNALYRYEDKLAFGQYILRVTDVDHKIFAQSYLLIDSFFVETYMADFLRGIFAFKVYLSSTNAAYEGKLKHITVSFDGGDTKELETYQGQLLYNTTPTTVAGNHTVAFTFGKDKVVSRVEYLRPVSLFEKPENIIMALIAVLLFGAGILIARPESVSYSVDVPDFPPLQAIAIPVKREAVVDLFEAVNKDMRWQQTPLSIADLKTGFKKILYRGRSVMVGDYNLEMILDKLREEGYLERAMDYYGLKRWERETKKSIHSLAMARALRDTFVNEGIPFLPFGQRGDADTVVSYGGEKVYIHVYETDSIIRKAIETASIGRSVLVFENELILRDFLMRIHSASEMNVIFKLLLESGKISVAPVGKLMDVLNRKQVFRY